MSAKDKVELDVEINKSICQFPFVHSHSTPKYERLLCCLQKGEPIAKEASIEEYWNSDRMKQIRLDMLAGKKIPECTDCYRNEKDGISTMRRADLIQGDFLTEETINTGHLDSMPIEFDYRTIHCNLSCVHCGTMYSSAHIPLAIKMGVDPKKVSHEFKLDYERESTKEIIDALDRRELTYIYWAGGEPMMSTQHWEVMQHMKDIYEIDPSYVNSINVMYNSNLTRSTWKKMDAYEFLAFCKPNFSPSLDGVGKTFEYIRDGGIWEEVEKNWISAYRNFYRGKSRNNSLTVALAVTSHWIFDCDKYLSFFEEYDIEIMPQRLQRWMPDEIIENTDDYAEIAKSNPILPGLVDPNFFPEHIMMPAFERAMERVEKTSLGGKQQLLNVIDGMRNEYLENSHKYNDILLKAAKTKTLELEKFKKNTLSDLLRDINPEAWLWYNSITT